MIWLVGPSVVLLPACIRQYSRESYIAAFYERTKYWNLTKLDQHVSEVMITTRTKFDNFPACGFLVILQNANMVANEVVNCVMNPYVHQVVLWWIHRVRALIFPL